MHRTVNMFYFTLPSNASAAMYPRNTASEYRTQLPDPVELEGDWEVGLAEIQYPKSWNSIPRNEFIKIGSEKIEVYEGTYNSFEDVFKHLNEDIKEKVQEKVRFKVISADKIAIENKTRRTIGISKDFGEMMGFNRRGDHYDAHSKSFICGKIQSSPNILQMYSMVYINFLYTAISLSHKWLEITKCLC